MRKLRLRIVVVCLMAATVVGLAPAGNATHPMCMSHDPDGCTDRGLPCVIYNKYVC